MERVSKILRHLSVRHLNAMNQAQRKYAVFVCGPYLDNPIGDYGDMIIQLLQTKNDGIKFTKFNVYSDTNNELPSFDDIVNNNYNGIQEIIGKIWIIFTILTFLISIISFLTLWKNGNYINSIITQIISLLLSFISCLIWILFDNICNDQTCLNQNKKQHFDLLITKHILFINSITIQIISCFISCIIIWFMINIIKHRYKSKYFPNIIF